VSLLTFILNIWHEHQENKKWQEFYSRLDRNKEGKFSQKKYLKDLNKTVKVEREKKASKQKDAKK
jgi:hypothetical protein